MDGFIVKRVSKLVAMKEVQSVWSVMCRLQMVACSGVVVPGEVSTLLIQVLFYAANSAKDHHPDDHQMCMRSGCILNADSKISEYTLYTRIYPKLHQW